VVEEFAKWGIGQKLENVLFYENNTKYVEVAMLAIANIIADANT
jgi:hypothetical protein